jgi:hypothetical protein
MMKTREKVISDATERLGTAALQQTGKHYIMFLYVI